MNDEGKFLEGCQFIAWW